MLEDKIKKFLTIDIDYATGAGYASGAGNGNGNGGFFTPVYGRYFGFGYGDGEGCGFLTNTGYGKGIDLIHHYTNDSSMESIANDYESCFKTNGYGIGANCVENNNIKEINGSLVYIVDNLQMIINSIHNNIAQGFILQSDLTLTPCYIVKGNNRFAHGETLKDAFNSLQEKLYDNSTDEERIEAFMGKFPEYDVEYENKDLFIYHHTLTGSCKMGREVFCKDKGLSLDDKTSVREFVKLTQNAYGGNIIKKLPNAYGIK